MFADIFYLLLDFISLSHRQVPTLIALGIVITLVELNRKKPFGKAFQRTKRIEVLST